METEAEFEEKHGVANPKLKASFYPPTTMNANPTNVSTIIQPLAWVDLKVHKNENFFGFDFDFCTVSLLVMLKYEGFVKNNFWLGHCVGGGRIIPRSIKTTGNKQNCF